MTTWWLKNLEDTVVVLLTRRVYVFVFDGLFIILLIPFLCFGTRNFIIIIIIAYDGLEPIEYILHIHSLRYFSPVCSTSPR
jgi:hypothetical protein